MTNNLLMLSSELRDLLSRTSEDVDVYDLDVRETIENVIDALTWAGSKMLSRGLRSDVERIDWLESRQGKALVSDDDSHWAVVEDGHQSLPLETPADIGTMFWIKKEQWRSSIREAIDAAAENELRYAMECDDN